MRQDRWGMDRLDHTASELTARKLSQAVALAGALLIGAATAAAAADAAPADAAADKARDVEILRGLLGVPAPAPAPAAPEPAAAAEPAATQLEPVMARLAKQAAQRRTDAEPADTAPTLPTPEEDAELERRLRETEAAAAKRSPAAPSPQGDAITLSTNANMASTPGYQVARALAAARNASRMQVAAP